MQTETESPLSAFALTPETLYGQRIAELELSGRILKRTIDLMSAEMKRRDEVRCIVESAHEKRLQSLATQLAESQKSRKFIWDCMAARTASQNSSIAELVQKLFDSQQQLSEARKTIADRDDEIAHHCLWIETFGKEMADTKRQVARIEERLRIAMTPSAQASTEEPTNG